MLWAIDHGYEYIEIFTNKLLESRKSHSFNLHCCSYHCLCAGHNDRDKIGLPRLIEAMESTMWSTVQRKPKPSTSTTNTPVPTTQSSSTTAPDSTPSTTSTSYEPPAPTNVSTTTAEENPFLPPQPDDEEDDDMHVFTQLAQAMEQARIVRDRARNENLSDSERREQAAKMMLKFTELLGLDESDDDE
jgi:hypothetical protein